MCKIQLYADFTLSLRSRKFDFSCCVSDLAERLRKIKLQELSNIVHEWNGHLVIFSLPQAIETSRQFLILRTDILHKTVVAIECPCTEDKYADPYQFVHSYVAKLYSRIEFPYA